MEQKRKPRKNAPVIQDDRFAKAQTDPRFAKIAKKKRDFKLDSRFKKMFESEEFNSSTIVDKHGRPVKQDLREELKKRYLGDEKQSKEAKGPKKLTREELMARARGELGSSSSESSDDEEAVGVPVLEAARQVGKAPREKPEGALDSSEEEPSDDELEDEEEIEMYATLQDEQVELGEETNRIAVLNMDWDYVKAVDLLSLFSSFCPSTGTIKSVTIYPSDLGLEKLKQDTIQGPRGVWNEEKAKAEEESDADSDADAPTDDESEAELDSEEEKGSDEEEEGAENSEDEGGLTNVDKLAAGVSFEDAEEEDEDAYDQNKLRQYELEKMKYFFAVIECSNVRTASTLFDQCDGLELETSANVMDLRFVPNGHSFADRRPRDTASKIPSDYKPIFFFTKALQNTKIELTWDRTDPRRMQVLRRKFNKDELANMDLKDYLASSDDEDERPKIAKKASAEVDETAIKSAQNKQRQKYLGLLSEITGVAGGEDSDDEGSSKKKKKGKKDKEMEYEEGDKELTFFADGEGIAERVAASMAEKKLRENETVWEKHLREKREKKKAAKKAAKGVVRDDDSDDEGAQGDSLFDDDVPVPKDDPFFQEVLAEREAEEGGKAKKTSKKQADNAPKGRKEKQAEEKRKAAELELLSLPNVNPFAENTAEAVVRGSDSEDEGDRKKSFKARAKAKKMEKLKARELKKKGLAPTEDQPTGASDAQQQETSPSGVDLSDPRFKALLLDPAFALDPTDPKFKRTAATDKILEERRKISANKKEQSVKSKNASAESAAESSKPEPAANNVSLSALVNSIKRKAATTSAPAPKKQKV